jgi:hypothetical protein
MAGATDYKFYRDVTKYGADPTGKKDASEAINAAIMDGDRCGMECGNTFSKGAIIYFPVRFSPNLVEASLKVSLEWNIQDLHANYSTVLQPVHRRPP